MKKILFLLMLPFAAMAQSKVQDYQHDSVFTYNVDSNYVDITPVQFQRGDTFTTDRITILSLTDNGINVSVEVKLGDRLLEPFWINPGDDYKGYVLYRKKYIFWRIADVYSLNIK
jgi:hypothetical protein